jgi:hypothetical protein
MLKKDPTLGWAVAALGDDFVEVSGTRAMEIGIVEMFRQPNAIAGLPPQVDSHGPLPRLAAKWFDAWACIDPFRTI